MPETASQSSTRVKAGLVIVLVVLFWYNFRSKDDLSSEYNQQLEVLTEQYKELGKFPNWNVSLIPDIWKNRTSGCVEQIKQWRDTRTHPTNMTAYLKGFLTTTTATPSVFANVDMNSTRIEILSESLSNWAGNSTAKFVSAGISLRPADQYLGNVGKLRASLVLFQDGSMFGIAQQSSQVLPLDLVGALPDDRRDEAYPAILRHVELRMEHLQKIIKKQIDAPPTPISGKYFTTCRFFLFAQVLPMDLTIAELQEAYQEYDDPTGHYVHSIPATRLNVVLEGINCACTWKSSQPIVGYEKRVLRSRDRTLAILALVLACGKLMLALHTFNKVTSLVDAHRVSWTANFVKMTIDALHAQFLIVASFSSDNARIYLSAIFVEMLNFTFCGWRVHMLLMQAHNSAWLTRLAGRGWLILTCYYALMIILAGSLSISFLSLPPALFILLCGLYSCETFQILHSARTCTTSALSMLEPMLGYAFRAFLPAYLISCPSNMLTLGEIEAYRYYAPIWMTWMILQVLVGLSQHVPLFNPRWMIPAQYRPLRYNYRPSMSQDESDALFEANEHPQCAICMCSLLSDEESTRRTIDLIRDDLMITPCNHVFHRECLVSWLGRRLQCPTCRLDLPAP